MSVGARIKQARKAVGFTQARLAEEVKALRGISSLTSGAVWQWESEESGTAPTMENLTAVAVVLGVNLEWLGTGRGEMWYREGSPQAWEFAVPPTGVRDEGSRYSKLIKQSSVTELLELFRKLTPNQRKALAKFIKEFV